MNLRTRPRDEPEVNLTSPGWITVNLNVCEHATPVA